MLHRMSMHFLRYLEMNDARAIAADLKDRGAAMDSAVGWAAQTASIILTLEGLESTVTRLDRAATRLQVAGVVLAASSVTVTAIAAFLALNT